MAAVADPQMAAAGQAPPVTPQPTYGFISWTGNFDDEVMRVAAASCGLQLLWAIPERPDELPPILSSSDPVLDQPQVVGLIINTRSDGFISNLTGSFFQSILSHSTL